MQGLIRMIMMSFDDWGRGCEFPAFLSWLFPLDVLIFELLIFRESCLFRVNE